VTGYYLYCLFYFQYFNFPQPGLLFFDIRNLFFLLNSNMISVFLHHARFPRDRNFKHFNIFYIQNVSSCKNPKGSKPFF
ncbi:hypothetical protein L9F63_021625, partial [Diploptera punctata]